MAGSLWLPSPKVGMSETQKLGANSTVYRNITAIFVEILINWYNGRPTMVSIRPIERPVRVGNELVCVGYGHVRIGHEPVRLWYETVLVGYRPSCVGYGHWPYGPMRIGYEPVRVP